MSLSRLVPRLASGACARRAGSVAQIRRQTQLPRNQELLHNRRTFSNAAQLRVKKYTEDHEWIEVSADGKTATLGISEYAASALGDVIYIELPETGSEVGHGDAIGAVESVKSASDIMTPVAGHVVETNPELESTPGLLNKSPEGEAWIAKIELAEGEVGTIDELMTAEKYKQFTEEVDAD